jgi:hypothetical protein
MFLVRVEVGELGGLEMSGSSKFDKVWKAKGEWEPKGDTSPALLSYSLPSNAVKLAGSVSCG